MKKISFVLDDEDFNKLSTIAKSEGRDPARQAYKILTREIRDEFYKLLATSKVAENV